MPAQGADARVGPARRGSLVSAGRKRHMDTNEAAGQIRLEDVPRVLAAVRSAGPLVQSITNYVSMDLAANAVLAVGASPAMVHDPSESGEFAAIAAALSINIG